MRAADNLDLAPAETWAEPEVQGSIDPDDGPVVVMVEYHVPLAEQPAFRQAVAQLTRLRLRDGALRAGVFTDLARPERLTEFFYVATWGEHVRQHHRFTRDDQLVAAQVRRFHSSPEPPRVTHFLAFPRTINVEVPAVPENLQGQQ